MPWPYCNVMTHRRPGFSMEPSIMLGIVPSARALNRVVAILMTFICNIIRATFEHSLGDNRNDDEKQ